MNRQKVGTAIKRNLLARAKLFAARENKCLNEVIEEALAQYLTKNSLNRSISVVQATKGSIPAPPEVVEAILKEESFIET